MKYNKLYNKVKTLAMVAAVAPIGAGMMSSCSDFLEVEPQNVITLDQFWNDANDVENVIAGCYSKMSDYGFLSRAMIWGEFRSENVINNGPINKDISLERILKENIMANNSYTDWTDYYKIINDCNTIMEYAPKVAEKDPSYTQSQLKADLAEATAIRSLCYFYLIRTFRDVPYYETAYLDDNQELDLPATSFNEILDKLINSLESIQGDIISKYPLESTSDSWVSVYDYYRITRPGVWAMLCEMYLWKKDYQNCVKYADMIINYKKNQAIKDFRYSESEFKNTNGYPLVSDRNSGMSNSYGNAFNSIFLKSNTGWLTESIFEIAFVQGSGSSLKSNVAAGNFYGGEGREPWVVYTTWVGDDEKNGTYKVFDKANKGLDARAYENMNLNGTYVNKLTCNGGTRMSLESGDEPWKKAQYPSQYPVEGSNKDSRNKCNWIVYRLSDIMLMKAEALTQMMSDNSETLAGTDLQYRDEAFNLINAVNKRSLMQQEPKDTLVRDDYPTKATITNLVYEERNRELMFEGKRFYDLVRRSQRDGNTDYLCEQVANKSVDLKSTIMSKLSKMDAIYWPYNLNECKANKNLKQNPAFGTGENSSYETSK